MVSSGKGGRNKARRAHTSLKLLCVVSDLTLSSEGRSAGSFLFGLGPEASVSREGEPMAGGGAAGDAGSAPAVGGGLHYSKRRPRCRIGLWALVATALSLASCKASRPASARVGLGAGLPLGGSRDKGGAWAAAGQLRGGALGGGKGRSGSGSSRQQDKHAQRETLYDAYNMLHTLAQVRTNFTCRSRFFFFLSFFFFEGSVWRAFLIGLQFGRVRVLDTAREIAGTLNTCMEPVVGDSPEEDMTAKRCSCLAGHAPVPCAAAKPTVVG